METQGGQWEPELKNSKHWKLKELFIFLMYYITEEEKYHLSLYLLFLYSNSSESIRSESYSLVKEICILSETWKNVSA